MRYFYTLLVLVCLIGCGKPEVSVTESVVIQDNVKTADCVALACDQMRRVSKALGQKCLVDSSYYMVLFRYANHDCPSCECITHHLVEVSRRDGYDEIKCGFGFSYFKNVPIIDTLRSQFELYPALLHAALTGNPYTQKDLAGSVAMTIEGRESK